MPIYEYRCSNCHRVFEEWCRHVEDADVKHACPVCNAEAKRLMSHTSFALKGGGWYATEYGTHKQAPACGKDCGTGNAGDCAASTKSNEACAQCPAAAAS